MSLRKKPGLGAVLIALLMTTTSFLAQAEEGEEFGWSDVAEFSYVVTDGNCETDTLGFKNKLQRRWERATFELNASGIRAENTTRDSFVVRLPGDTASEPRETTEKTAENYYLNGKFGRQITDRFFWHVGAGWDRNRFAGIENRYSVSGGVGNIWVDKEKVKFRTDYALSYTDQEDVVQNPNVGDTFAGFRFSWTYVHDLGESSTYGNDLILDENLDETEDLRADMTNWVIVSINKRLALKVSLQLLYDNLPSIEEYDVFIDPNAPPNSPDGTDTRELDELDTIFTTSLVVNF